MLNLTHLMQVVVNPNPLLPWPDAPTLSTSKEGELWDPQLIPDPSQSRTKGSPSSPSYKIIVDSDKVTSLILQEERRQSNGKASSSSSFGVKSTVLTARPKITPSPNIDLGTSLPVQPELDPGVSSLHQPKDQDQLSSLLDELEAATSYFQPPSSPNATPPVDAKTLLFRIREAKTAASISQIVMPMSKRRQSDLGLRHVAAAMTRLASLSFKASAASSPSDAAHANEAYARNRLWMQLLHKAPFLLHSADLHSLTDILDSIQSVAALRCGSHPPPGLSSPRSRVKAKASHMTQEGLVDEGDWQSFPQDSEGFSDSFEVDTDDEQGKNLSPLLSSARPLHSGRSLLKDEQSLVAQVLTSSTAILSQSSIPVDSLLRLANAAGRLRVSPPDPSWLLTLLSTSTKLLPSMTQGELISLATAISRLPFLGPSDPSQAPSPQIESWSAAFYDRSMRSIRGYTIRDITCLLTCASRLPKPRPLPWIESMLQRAIELTDEMDPLAFALILHSIGRLRLSRSLTKIWVREILERSTNQLSDFSSEELSLVLRSCAMMRIVPDEDWLTEFFSLFHPSRSSENSNTSIESSHIPRGLDLLRSSSGPQLSNIGWSLALLRCLPPRQWIHEWQQQIRKRISSGEKPYGTPWSKWHGVGYALHAKRSAVALRAFEVPFGSSSGREGDEEGEIEAWCQILRTPVPGPLPLHVGGVTRKERAESGLEDEEGASDPNDYPFDFESLQVGS